MELANSKKSIKLEKSFTATLTSVNFYFLASNKELPLTFRVGTQSFQSQFLYSCLIASKEVRRLKGYLSLSVELGE